MSRAKEELHDEGNIDLARRVLAAYISHKQCIGLDDAFKNHASELSELPGRYCLIVARFLERG